MKKLTVFYEGWDQRWPLGTLADNGRQIIFEYSADALANGIEFSPQHLKLRREAYGPFPKEIGYLPGLLYDCLPDGWGLLLMDRLFRRAGLDPARISPLDRLAFIGERAMGALAFVPSQNDSEEVAHWSLMQLAQAAQNVADDNVAELRVLAQAGGSPHGARPKALVMFDAVTRIVSTADDGTGEPWLVKFPAQSEHPEVCAIEHIYAQMARECDIVMGPTEYFDLDENLAAFGTRRFDRMGPLRVPVHSLAGALHADFRIPCLDYETVLRATGFFTQNAQEVMAAFRLCVFNVVFNNRDDHAKNFSLRMNEEHRWDFAPGYDLTFNAGPGGYHQTSVMGEALAPGRPHLLALAAKLGLRLREVEHTIDKTCAVAEGLAMALHEANVRGETVHAIAGAVASNVQRCCRA
ncbi:type II toxin-antitoxin system HipA family toxin [Xanthomonas euvesicatoria]|uniref:Serine/threonine-protein kinase HipA n=1 Tax=Xanthomonas euvesicatoria TaxID=456327 RepID=A0AAW3U4C7_XANEU|nr:type II toxin-antitoxin system HipA family toxin [Xanthomonas euvesicatoria]MBB4723350.1 serine/threonine-protein kinase HipA [Xanthomonas euvesicatoria]MBB4870138.1 serine/threonine-protein kinase HipA [Xanthomonas euvesicatoria]